jgi:hypothetical protein
LIVLEALLREKAIEVFIMSQIKNDVSVRIVGSNGAESRGTVSIEEFDEKTKIMRGLKTFAVFFGCALVAVFIPGLHFVLVPGLLIAGFGFGYSAFQKPSMVCGGKGVCPKCGAEFQIVRNPPNWPLKDVCAKCFENVKISPTE